MSVLSGGCACGAIRYTCTSDPLFSLNCHCWDCQRESGSAFVPILAVPKTAFAVVRGDPRRFDVIADSGYTTTRAFCGDCGAPLFGLPGSAPEIVTLRAGSLDDPSSFQPSQDIFTASAQPWDHMNPQLPKVAKRPEDPFMNKLTLVISLYVDPDREAEFERFEAGVADLMERHGGRIERRVSLSPSADLSQPHEVHIVTFPDPGSFERYRRDPAVQALAPRRAELIRQTAVWSGVDRPSFGAAGAAERGRQP